MFCPVRVPDRQQCPIEKALVGEWLEDVAAFVGIEQISRPYIVTPLVSLIAELAEGCQQAWLVKLKREVNATWLQDLAGLSYLEPAAQMVCLIQRGPSVVRGMMAKASGLSAVQYLEEALADLLVVSCGPVVRNEMICQPPQGGQHPYPYTYAYAYTYAYPYPHPHLYPYPYLYPHLYPYLYLYSYLSMCPYLNPICIPNPIPILTRKSAPSPDPLPTHACNPDAGYLHTWA